MRRRIALLALTLAAGFALALAAPEGHHRPWSDVDHWSAVFDDPERDTWQRPLAVIDFLAVEPGDVVADLGAGTGYFTRLLSIQVGAEGSRSNPRC